MGFTTLKTENLPVGMKIKKNNAKFLLCYPNYRRNKVELKTKYIYFIN